MSDSSQMQDWAQERLADPGDDLYYAVLFSPRPQRDNVRAVAALYAELEATVTHFRDMHVARTKLAWWRDELERLSAGNAAHPVTRTLAGTMPATAETALADLITGMELILLEGPVTDPTTARMHAEHGGARLITALAALFSNDGTGEMQSGLGIGIGLARLLDRANLDGTAQKEVARTAQALLASNHSVAAAAPQPLGVLAALGWQAATNSPPARRRSDPARVYTAWRAARHHLPRKMSKIGA